MRISISKKPIPKTKSTVAVSFFFNKQLSDLDDGRKLFEIINLHGFPPEKYSSLKTKKKRQALNFSELHEILPRIWLPQYFQMVSMWLLDEIDIYRTKAPKYWGHIWRDWLRNPKDQSRPVFHSDISIYIEADTLKKNELTAKLERLINDLINYSEVDFARVQYYSAEEEFASTHGEEPQTVLVARQLSEQCLPDLYNISVWGKPYIEFFGREKLLSAPCYKVEELPSGVIRMQLAPDVYDEKGSWTAIKDVREKCKGHLNNNAFFDPRLYTRQLTVQDLANDPVLGEKFVTGELMKERYKVYKVPQFDLSDIRKPLKIPEKDEK